ncbi:unnamed protein product [Vitrella brassicaformis CCMP3155]|uniref:Uncharacterized protein n=1 Tax=Vitrella brassicaformis (strain CCMP3155) TaxID=1169540 RepID=A0A0G4FKY2_VITBC|nr:unnamed protein product [Vitrella brassicaformis CCMP3155]|eukprot:CEM14631.1 unnamed protein product [Vitrella brassicaformis CCMP3155]
MASKAPLLFLLSVCLALLLWVIAVFLPYWYHKKWTVVFVYVLTIDFSLWEMNIAFSPCAKEPQKLKKLMRQFCESPIMGKHLITDARDIACGISRQSYGIIGHSACANLDMVAWASFIMTFAVGIALVFELFSLLLFVMWARRGRRKGIYKKTEFYISLLDNLITAFGIGGGGGMAVSYSFHLAMAGTLFLLVPIVTLITQCHKIDEDDDEDEEYGGGPYGGPPMPPPPPDGASPVMYGQQEPLIVRVPPGTVQQYGATTTYG